MVSVKIKVLPGGTMPTKATEGSAGFDCYALIQNEFNAIPENCYIRPGENKLIPLGFCMELPPGYEAQLRPRSGLGKEGICVLLGTIDCDYRGQLSANVFNHSWKQVCVKNGQRIGQLVIQKLPEVEFVAAEELNESGRGERGFGSSGL